MFLVWRCKIRLEFFTAYVQKERDDKPIRFSFFFYFGDCLSEMGTYNLWYNTSCILHGFLHVYYYVFYALSFLHNVVFMWWGVN